MVLAVESGGRFSVETVEFLRQLAEAKALTVPAFLRASAAVAYQRRWTRLLAVSVATAFAESLLAEKDVLVTLDHGVAREPWLQDVLTGARHDVGDAADV